MNLIGKTIVAQNASLSFPADVWMSCGLPSNAVDGPVQAVDTQGNIFRVVLEGRELFVRCPLLAGEKKTLTLESAVSETGPDATKTVSRGASKPFTAAAWVKDELLHIMPQFTAEWDGQEITADRITLIGEPRINGARARYRFRTRFQTGVPLWVEGFYDIFDNQELVEFKLLLTWGSTDGEHVQSAGVNHTNERLGRVWMNTLEVPLVDNRNSKGLAPVESHNGRWRAELANPVTWSVDSGLWHHATSIRVTGAIQCLPPAAEIGAWLLSDERYLNMQHREEASARCMLASTHWEGHWGPLGHIPVLEAPGVAEASLANFYSSVYADEANGNNENPYPYYNLFVGTNNPEAGSTGAQADFGMSNCVYVISMDEPGALHWYNRSVDGWVRRPYLYREPDGEFMVAKDHPNCGTFSMMPHEGWGTDFLGYDLPLAVAHPNGHWAGGSYWSTMDEQHRSDNLLWNFYALTLDPTVEILLRGTMELDKLVFWYPSAAGGAPGQSVGSPRGWGRPLISMCWGYHCGLIDTKDAIVRYMEALLHNYVGNNPTYANSPMKPFSRWQQAFGYTVPQPNGEIGPLIQGITAWQESICMMGAYCAYRMGLYPEGTREDVLQMLLDVGRTVRDYCIYDYQGTYMCTGVYSWNEGEPWPAANLYPGVGGPNDPGYNPYVATWNGWFEWTAPAVRIIEELDPTVRGQEILAQLGESSAITAAQWWAVTPMGS